MPRIFRPLPLIVAGVIAALSFLAPASAASGRVPILVYHRFGPTVADSMTTRTATFAAQLDWLSSHHYRIIPLRRLLDALGEAGPMPSRAVVITADDGHESVYREMFPLIERYRIPVTLFIYPSAISNASYAMTWSQLGELSHSGLVDIQSHTYWHPNFDHERAKLSVSDYRAFVMTQFTRSKQVLERHLGSPVDLLAWPFGIHDPELERWASEAGYRAAFTLQRLPIGPGSPMLSLPRFLMTDADGIAQFASLIQRATGETP